MAFLLQNWNRVSTSANEPTVTLANGVVVGAPQSYSYYTLDTQATVAAANYFAPTQSLNVCNDLSVGSSIEVYSATDGTRVSYTVTAIVQNPASITISATTSLITANVAISNAQMLAGIYGFPVQIVAAPGAGRVIQVVSGSFEIIGTATQFTNGGAAQIQYASTVHGAGTNAFAETVSASSINGATASNIQLLLPAAQAMGVSTALAGVGLFLSCATGEFTAGTGTAVVSLQYRIITL